METSPRKEENVPEHMMVKSFVLVLTRCDPNILYNITESSYDFRQIIDFHQRWYCWVNYSALCSSDDIPQHTMGFSGINWFGVYQVVNHIGGSRNNAK